MAGEAPSQQLIKASTWRVKTSQMKASQLDDHRQFGEGVPPHILAKLRKMKVEDRRPRGKSAEAKQRRIERKKAPKKAEAVEDSQTLAPENLGENYASDHMELDKLTLATPRVLFQKSSSNLLDTKGGSTVWKQQAFTKRGATLENVMDWLSPKDCDLDNISEEDVPSGALEEQLPGGTDCQQVPRRMEGLGSTRGGLLRGRLQPTRAGQSSASSSIPSISCSGSLDRLSLRDAFAEQWSKVSREGQSSAAVAATADVVALRAAAAPNESDNLADMHRVLSQEQDNWDRRQQRAGAIARLVKYCCGQMPSTDITLAGGNGRPVHLVSVREKGVAARSGARIGDRLVSINGKKDFMDLPATTTQDRLKAPATLVVMGFVGRPDAEVRLRNTKEAWGIPNHQDTLRGDRLELRDVTVMNKNLALMTPLWLTTIPPKEDVTSCQPNSNECKSTCAKPELQSSTGIAGKRSAQAGASSHTRVVWRRIPGHSTGWSKHVVSTTPCFELRPLEAHDLVQRAMWSLASSAATRTPTDM